MSRLATDRLGSGLGALALACLAAGSPADARLTHLHIDSRDTVAPATPGARGYEIVKLSFS